MEILQVTLGIVFSRRLHLALRYLSSPWEYLLRIPGTPHIQGKGTLHLGQHFLHFLSFILFGRSGHFYSRVSKVSNCVRVQAGILEFLLSGPPPRLDGDGHGHGHGHGSGLVWSIFFINFFSALEGVEIAFLFCFFGLWVKLVGLVVFFSHIQMNVVVSGIGPKGKGRKGRKGRNLQV